MRSTLDVIIAVQANEPVEHDELRLALAAFASIQHFIEKSHNDLIEAVEEKSAGQAKLRASFAKDTRERMFQAMKKDPREWLGPGGIPGNPEQVERRRLALSVARQAGIL